MTRPLRRRSSRTRLPSCGSVCACPFFARNTSVLCTVLKPAFFHFTKTKLLWHRGPKIQRLKECRRVFSLPAELRRGWFRPEGGAAARRDREDPGLATMPVPRLTEDVVLGGVGGEVARPDHLPLQRTWQNRVSHVPCISVGLWSVRGGLLHPQHHKNACLSCALSFFSEAMSEAPHGSGT